MRYADISDPKGLTRGTSSPMVPLHFGHDTALLVPRSGLIAEAGVETANMIGRATDRSRKQMGNVPLENRVRFEADDVE